jgi:high-affinity Fe2+/Pb2+ permease
VIISAPLLAVALGVGLFIGVIQAATSINEMTLSFIPKLVVMGIYAGSVWRLAAEHAGGLHPRYLQAHSRAVFLKRSARTMP